MTIVPEAEAADWEVDGRPVEIGRCALDPSQIARERTGNAVSPEAGLPDNEARSLQ